MHSLPDVLYADHGSDFTSDHLAAVAADLHIELVHSAVARPQGRGKVERFFGTVTRPRHRRTLPEGSGPGGYTARPGRALLIWPCHEGDILGCS